MKRKLERIFTIAALVLIVVVCMASCGENAKEEKVVADEIKGNLTTKVADSAKTETPNELTKVEQSFIWPVEDQKKLKIETEFGFKIDPVDGYSFLFHSGVDIKADLGDKVLASADGKVVKAEWYGGYGNHVVVEHKNGIQTIYGHLSKILVKKDVDVKKGDIIGLAGSTGYATKPSIHFEVKVKDKNDKDGGYLSRDPMEFMKN